MIDLHCHVLPGLDDGARDLADSVAMARQAQADGIAAICATPHIRHDHAVEIGELPERIAALEAELARQQIAVRILPGGELAETEADGLGDEQLRAISLGGAGDWVLLEPAPGPLGTALRACAARLLARGLGVVIAHPERHPGEDWERHLAALVEQGCLIQWTAAFVADPAHGEWFAGLARRGLVHLLGSDAHTSHAGRPVALSAGFARLRETLPAETVAWMAETLPRTIVGEGESTA